ncbi:MAG TPA: GIY-YIG nuclease family protein [Devosia sp.]|nr:GIY-YIG nuclease family protein [Devosia sp.]
MAKTFIVYMMASRRDGTIYIGVSGNPLGRIWQHKNDSFEGFTKRYGAHRLVWYEVHESAEAPIRREKQLKEWHRAWKVRLIEEHNPEWRDLYSELTGETD